MSQDLDDRLAKAVEERDQLKAEIQRIQGRKEAALKTLEDVRAEIIAKNLDPDSLDDTLTKIQAAYQVAVDQFEQDVQNTRKILTPYMEIT